MIAPEDRKSGTRVLVLNRRGRDREAEIVEVINSTVFRIKYTGKDEFRGVFTVGLNSIVSAIE